MNDYDWEMRRQERLRMEAFGYATHGDESNEIDDSASWYYNEAKEVEKMEECRNYARDWYLKYNKEKDKIE